LLTYFT